MKFIPAPREYSFSLMTHQYFWQADRAGNGRFYLYQEEQLVASLCLQEEKNHPPVLKLSQETLLFQENSTFFDASILIIDKDSGLCSGRINKNSLKSGEGSIRLKGQVYGWKYKKQTDSFLLVMDQKRRKLFSYHYGPDFVRLILNKTGKDNHQVISLLSIGLYLLPVWQREKSE